MVDRRAARGGFLSASRPIIAVLATMDTKSNEARFVADVLTRAGAAPWIVDLSMKSHTLSAGDVSGAQVAEAVGVSWQALDERSRQEAAAVMVQGGTRILLERYSKGEIAGAIGVGGANGTNLVCSILRALPYLLPKIMISTVAGTAAVQWYVAESDIAMYPSIGDVSLNRITRAVIVVDAAPPHRSGMDAVTSGNRTHRDGECRERGGDCSRQLDGETG